MLISPMTRPGLEPGTYGLKVVRSIKSHDKVRASTIEEGAFPFPRMRPEARHVADTLLSIPCHTLPVPVSLSVAGSEI